jgi:hypothetical protein
MIFPLSMIALVLLFLLFFEKQATNPIEIRITKKVLLKIWLIV